MLQTKDKPQSYPFTIPHFFTTISKSGVNLKENVPLQLLFLEAFLQLLR